LVQPGKNSMEMKRTSLIRSDWHYPWR